MKQIIIEKFSKYYKYNVQARYSEVLKDHPFIGWDVFALKGDFYVADSDLSFNAQRKMKIEFLLVV